MFVCYIKPMTYVKMTYRNEKHLPLVIIYPQKSPLKCPEKIIRCTWTNINYKVQRDLQISECYIKLLTYVTMTYRTLLNKNILLGQICPKIRAMKLCPQIRSPWTNIKYILQKELKISECYISIIDLGQNDILHITE